MSATILKRYTTISSALDLLWHKRLALLSPALWDDKNDAYFLELYRRSKEFEKVFAACCTMAGETYHHWRVFTQGAEGVCVELLRGPLLDSIENSEEIFYASVEYRRLTDLRTVSSKDVGDLPFLKRSGFGDEKEFRIIVQLKKSNDNVYYIPIDIKWVKRIIVNPWMPLSLFDSVKDVIRGVPDCSSLKVVRSSLIDNTRWKQAGDELVLHNTSD